MSRALGLRLRDEMNSTATGQDASSPSASSSSSVGAVGGPPGNGGGVNNGVGSYPYYYYARRPDSRGMRQSPSVSSSDHGIRHSPSVSSCDRNPLRQSPSVTSSIGNSRAHGLASRIYGPSSPSSGMRPRSSVVPLPHDISVETHRRVRSIGDIEKVTVTPV